HRGPSSVHGAPSNRDNNGVRSSEGPPNSRDHTADGPSNQRASSSAGRQDTSIRPPTCSQDPGKEAARRRLSAAAGRNIHNLLSGLPRQLRLKSASPRIANFRRVTEPPIILFSFC